MRRVSVAVVAMISFLASPTLAADKDEAVNVADLPANVRSAIESVHSGTNLYCAIRRSTVAGSASYGVTFGRKGEVVRAFVSPAGRIDREERVIALAAAPEPVRKAVTGSKVKQVFGVFPVGKSVAARYELVLVREKLTHLVVVSADGAVQSDETLEPRISRIREIGKALDDLGDPQKLRGGCRTPEQQRQYEGLRRELRAIHEWLDERVVRVGMPRELVREILGDDHGDSDLHSEWPYRSNPGPDGRGPCFYVVRFVDDRVTSTSFDVIYDLEGGK